MKIDYLHPQRRTRDTRALFFLLLFSLFSITCVSVSIAQTGEKVVQGRVVGAGGKPQPGAIVYLKNEKTNAIKSFISTGDGGYRFGQLSPEIDYEIWAEYQGKKSPEKTVSSFDSKKNLSYELKVDTAK
jgi:hypothetical protein